MVFVRQGSITNMYIQFQLQVNKRYIFHQQQTHTHTHTHRRRLARLYATEHNLSDECRVHWAAGWGLWGGRHVSPSSLTLWDQAIRCIYITRGGVCGLATHHSDWAVPMRNNINTLFLIIADIVAYLCYFIIILLIYRYYLVDGCYLLLAVWALLLPIPHSTTYTLAIISCCIAFFPSLFSTPLTTTTHASPKSYQFDRNKMPWRSGISALQSSSARRPKPTAQTALHSIHTMSYYGRVVKMYVAVITLNIL